MEYRRLGKAGVRVSALSLGSWVNFGQQVDDDIARELMTTAYDKGINFFDNAEAYEEGRAETVMGNILHKADWSRDTFLVSSKVFWGGKRPTQEGLNRKHILEACNASLRRLKLDYLDFYYCHTSDRHTPLEETVRAMSDLVTQGKVIYWGTSGWKAKKIVEAHKIARKNHLVPPTMEQTTYNLFHRKNFERNYAHLFSRYGMGAATFHALAMGLLTGKHTGGPLEGTRATNKATQWIGDHLTKEMKEKGEKLSKLKELADELEVSLAVFSIAWCLRHPNVSTVILGASKSSQLIENLKAIEVQKKFTPEVLRRVDKIVGTYRKRYLFF